ncbi:hypothetical protein LCGC14_0263330 [marine sediment metagenome]|uniref:Uncharacterized protein n=1 Tax=marine sediment metagenome TaxID=412755 RepID=A0A0F9X649_9ZZZZ
MTIKMSWTDKIATEEILKLRDEFNINTAVETGTFRGTNTELYAHHFREVLSIDVDEAYFEPAGGKLRKYQNVQVFKQSSDSFLLAFTANYLMHKRDDIIFFYLDAHFYDPKLPPEDKWVVVKELKALKGFGNCVICIHDFDCQGLGHLVYGGEHLGWNVVGEHITKVNLDFHYYTNTREWCDIYNEETVKELPITIDEYVIDNLKYANSSDEKRYRGILYAVPAKLDLNKFRVVECGLRT